MATNRERIKGRRNTKPFFQFPREILDSAEYAKMSAIAVKLLLDLCSQYRGNNNGDLCCAWKLMVQRGWKSRDTLFRAISDLENNGWIERTRQGGRNKPNLYAVTWIAIDECKGKLDVRETRVASNKWKEPVTRLSCEPYTDTVSVRANAH